MKIKQNGFWRIYTALTRIGITKCCIQRTFVIPCPRDASWRVAGCTLAPLQIVSIVGQGFINTLVLRLKYSIFSPWKLFATARYITTIITNQIQFSNNQNKIVYVGFVFERLTICFINDNIPLQITEITSLPYTRNPSTLVIRSIYLIIIWFNVHVILVHYMV